MASLKCFAAVFIPIVFLIFATPAQAQLRRPDAINGVPMKLNPTATVTAVCRKLHEKDYSQAFHASCYSEINKVVVVLVSGNTKEYSGKAIADFIVGEFEKSYIPAAGFFYMPEWKGVTMTFLLNGDAYGPYSGENWRDGFETLKIHTPQAWFKN